MQGDEHDGTHQETDQTNATPGFAIEIKDDTELGLAMLIADLGDGHYQPIGVVVSINEAREIAASDMRGRMRDLEAGETPRLPGKLRGLGAGTGRRLPRSEAPDAVTNRPRPPLPPPASVAGGGSVPDLLASIVHSCSRIAASRR